MLLAEVGNMAVMHSFILGGRSGGQGPYSPRKILVIGILSKPHTSESNSGFFFGASLALENFGGCFNQLRVV